MTVLWALFLGLVLLLLALDLGVLNRGRTDLTIREACVWTVGWITLGVGFSGVVYAIYEFQPFGSDVALANTSIKSGWEAASLYITAYLLEKSLSVDNIFVIAMLFDSFCIAGKDRRRILYWGILGALILRAVMIFGGVWLVSKFTWVFYIFGCYLIYAGLSLLKAEEEEENPYDSWYVKALSKVLPLAKGEFNGQFFTVIDGKRYVTILFLALVAIEWTDVVFALDSIPAVLAITNESFIVFTSNIFAILGLRSLFFVLNGMLHKFGLLKYALALILTFIGIKLVAHGYFHIPNWVSLSVIVGSLSLAIVGSLLSKNSDEPKDDPEAIDHQA